MSLEIIVILIFGSLLLFLLVGIPVSFSLFGLSIVIALIMEGSRMIPVVYFAFFGVITKDIYLSIPFFVFMAGILEFSGIVSDVYGAAHKWFGPVNGGLAVATIATCCVIDAMSGLGATATVTMGILSLPEMLKRGYHKNIALGCIPSGGALGPVIPPSVVMIILGGATGISIGKLFVAGLLPGLLIASLWSIYILMRCYLKPSLGPALPLQERASLAVKLKELRRVWLAFLIVIAVLGSIYTGVCTVTEAAAVGALGALVSSLIRRSLRWENLKSAILMTVKVTGMVFWLLVGGISFGHILTITPVAVTTRNVMLSMTGDPLTLIIIMQLIGVFLGCFIDSGAIILICIPIFWPMVANMPNVDPLWWGLVFTLTVCLGYITPPFGMNLFYMRGIVPKDINLADIYRSVIPFCLIYVLGIAICLVFPQIALWLPGLLMK